MPLGKSVQIDTQLFLALYNYFFDDDNAPQDYEADEIRRKLQEKVDKLIDREIFTRYKRASTPQEREEYRQKRDYKIICEKLDLIEAMFDIWG